MKRVFFLLSLALVLVSAQGQVKNSSYGCTDIDDIALLGEWTAISHTNNSDPITKIVFKDSGGFESFVSGVSDDNHVQIYRKYGNMRSYEDYWVCGSMVGKHFTLHMKSSTSDIHTPRSARFIISSFYKDDMVLKTFDGWEEITLKRNYTGGNEDNGDFVDLGLPSGLMWAKYNLGASNENESGYYYAWGETTPNKSVYNESSYLVDWNSLPSNISGTQYDPAYLTLGEGYRMPTKYEFDELIAYCTWAYSEVEHGYRITGPNGNSILLPFTGGKEEDYYVGYFPGIYYGQGFYMSGTKSLYDYLYNWYLYMDNDPRFGMYMYNAHRGQTIRPVKTGTSGINNVKRDTDDTVDVYSVSGQLVKEKVPVKELRNVLEKGVYVIRGQKIMIGAN